MILIYTYTALKHKPTLITLSFGLPWFTGDSYRWYRDLVVVCLSEPVCAQDSKIIASSPSISAAFERLSARSILNSKQKVN